MYSVTNTSYKIEMKLYCFTCAGGSKSFFDFLDIYVKPYVEVIKMEYSGHGSRRREGFYESFLELAQDMYKDIYLHYNGEEYALFGYSMGSISVIETLKYVLKREEIAVPIHVFLAAYAPSVQKELERMKEEELFDCWVRERTIRFGGIPENLINNESFWRICLPIYKADYMMLRKYDYRHINLKSDIPVTIFYSEKDTPHSQIKKWTRYFIGECEMIPFEGNHFFIRDHKQEIARVIIRKLGF